MTGLSHQKKESKDEVEYVHMKHDRQKEDPRML